jgi:hypothetical protein
MIMSATIAIGIVRDMPKVATKGVVQTTERALTTNSNVTIIVSMQ